MKRGFGPCWCGQPITAWLSEPTPGEFLYVTVCTAGHRPDDYLDTTP